MNILKDKGIFAFICSNKFAKAKYGEKLRKLILENQLKIYNDFTGVKVFKEASVDTCVIQIKKDYVNDNEIFVNDEYFMEQNRLDSNSFTFNSPEILNLRDKIFNQGTMIKDLDIQINYGIKTGFNDAFIIDEATKNRLIKEDSNNKEIIKPLLRGRDINKWKIMYKDLYIIFTRRGIEINNYPSIKKYLSQWKEELTPKTKTSKSGDKGRKPGPYKWYEIQDNVAYYAMFEKEKIIYSTIAPEPRFAYDNKKHFMLDSGFILTSENLNVKYLIALLNSDLLFWYFKDICYSLNTKGYQYKKIFVDQLPIVINENYEKEVISTVDEILELSYQIRQYEQKLFLYLYENLGIINLSKKIESFYLLNEKQFLKEIKQKNKSFDEKELLNLFNLTKNEIRILNNKFKLKNDILNNLVYDIYNLDDSEKRIIKKNF